MITVAVLGPEDLIDRVLSLSRQLHALSLVPYPYNSERETLAILNQCAPVSDIILFTGPIPYAIARQAGGHSLPMFYVSYSAGALHVVLLSHVEAHGRRKGDPLRMSIDTLESFSVHKMLDEYGATQREVHVCERKTTPTEADLVAFHQQLYRDGRTDFAVTGLTSAYQRLCALGIPAYRLTITEAAIRVALSLVDMEAGKMTQRDGELCVGTVRVINGAAVRNESPSEYENRRLRLVLMNQFIDFCEEIRASIRIDDDDTYVFFANRGALEPNAQGDRVTLLIEKARASLPFELSVGLGYGHSAYAAEQNSREALRHAMHQGKGCYITMLADGSLHARRPEGPSIRYVSRTEEPWMLELSEKSKISINVISKVASSMTERENASFSANDIAGTLGLTLRSARRILQRLEEAGGIAYAGREQPPGAGRPRKIYRFAKAV